MGFCLECGETTSQNLCFECFSRFDILEADAELLEYQIYIMKGKYDSEKFDTYVKDGDGDFGEEE